MKSLAAALLLLAVLTGRSAAAMLGGFSKIDDSTNDGGVLLAKEAVAKQLSSQGNGAPVELEVLSAERQVVAGTNYRLTLRASTPGQPDKVYSAQVWEKLPVYGGEMQVTKLEEVPRAQTESHGGPVRAAVELFGPAVEEAAAYAVQQLSQQSNSLFPFQLKQILSVSSAKPPGSEATVHTLKLKVAQGNMPDETFQVEVAQQASGHRLQSSQVLAA